MGHTKENTSGDTMSIEGALDRFMQREEFEYNTKWNRFESDGKTLKINGYEVLWFDGDKLWADYDNIEIAPHSTYCYRILKDYLYSRRPYAFVYKGQKFTPFRKRFGFGCEVKFIPSRYGDFVGVAKFKLSDKKNDELIVHINHYKLVKKNPELYYRKKSRKRSYLKSIHIGHQCKIGDAVFFAYRPFELTTKHTLRFYYYIEELDCYFDYGFVYRSYYFADLQALITPRKILLCNDLSVIDEVIGRLQFIDSCESQFTNEIISKEFKYAVDLKVNDIWISDGNVFSKFKGRLDGEYKCFK